MKHWRWLLLGCSSVVVAGACSDGPTEYAPDDDVPETGLGGADGAGGDGGEVLDGAGVGKACSNDEACRAGLRCSDGVCEPAGNRGEGEACIIGPECEAGLQCVAGTCVPEGEGEAGEPCANDASCRAGLKCDGTGQKTCVPAGTGDLGDRCEQNVDCFVGLDCNQGVCEPTTDTSGGGGRFQGVECDDVPGEVRAYFEVPGADDAEELDFFRLPFPNDIRFRDGSVDLSGFPTPGGGLLGVNLVQRYVDAIEKNDGGFGAYTATFFRFSGELDAETLRRDGAIRFVDITPNSEEFGRTPGFSWYYSVGRSPYVCDNWFAIRPPLGRPLLPGHTYAIWFTTDVKAEDGSSVKRAPNLVSLLADETPDDPALEHAYETYAVFRDYLADQNIDPKTILNAAVFTVAPVHDTMAKVAAAIEKLPAPTAKRWVKCEDGVESPCADGSPARACETHDEYDEYHALVSLPIFQKGKAPYETLGGNIDTSGTPEREDVCLALTIPKGESMPEAGWPLVVFAHGTGGGFRSHVRPEVAGVLSKAPTPFALLGIDQVVHGPRRGQSSQSPENLFFNFVNPDAARGNPIQGAADQLSLAKFAASLELSAQDSGGGPIKVDATQLFFFGHSQGATQGSLALPFSTLYRAAVLSGNGASLMDALLTKTEPVDITRLVPTMISDPGVVQVKTLHPVLNLLQAWLDPADPLHFSRLLTREPLDSYPPKHVFQTFGLNDHYSPPVTMQSFALAGLIPHVSPHETDLGLSKVEAPVAGNVTVNGVPFTLGLRQYEPPSGADGHFVVFDVKDANDDMVRFFTSALGGAPVIGD